MGLRAADLAVGQVYETVLGDPPVMAHGMLVMNMTGTAITDYLGDGRLTSFGGRFVAASWPGDTLRARLTVAEVTPESVRFDIDTVNQEGTTVFAGSATGRLDSEEERV